MKGQHTVNEMAANFGVPPHQVVQWKKQALEALPDAFSTRRVREAQDKEA
jgi:putative transposase